MITLNYYVLIGIAILIMFFGYFFGLFEGRGQGYKKRKKEEDEEKLPQPEADVDNSGNSVLQQIQTEDDARELESKAEDSNEPSIVEETLPPPAPPEPIEPSLLRLSQGAEGRLQLDLDDERVNISALTPDQRKRLIALLTAMRPWLESKKEVNPRYASTPAPASSVAQKPKAPASKTQTPLAVDEPPTAPQSMVAQIDAILQARLSGTPLGEKGISLREPPEGGVQVWVGLNKYHGIDDVPDEEVRAAIRAAIAEWENTFTPGL